MLIHVLSMVLKNTMEEFAEERRLQLEGLMDPAKAKTAERPHLQRMLTNKQNSCLHATDSELVLVMGHQYANDGVDYGPLLKGKTVEAYAFQLHATCRKCHLDHYFEMLITPEALQQSEAFGFTS